LDERKRRFFSALGVFPEDADIPIGIVSRLWSEIEALDEFASEDLLSELYSLSLLLDLNLDTRTFRFHDTTRHYLRHQAGKGKLASQHRTLIASMEPLIEAGSVADVEYYLGICPST
jgi:hypothetical protein